MLCGIVDYLIHSKRDWLSGRREIPLQISLNLDKCNFLILIILDTAWIGVKIKGVLLF